MSNDAHTAGGLAGDATGADAHTEPVWRYADMCRHWNVSRTTVERWVRRYEKRGEGIPVHRDPSGRPYWLPEEAAAARPDTSTPIRTQPVNRIARTDDERLARLRRAAQRGHRVA